MFLGYINTGTWPSRLGESRIWERKIWSWIPQDWDLRWLRWRSPAAVLNGIPSSHNTAVKWRLHRRPSELVPTGEGWKHTEEFLCQSQSQVALRLALYRQSVRLGNKPLRPTINIFYFPTEHLRLLSLCNILSDERMGLSFTIAIGPRQRSHSQVRVLRDSWPYFTASDSRLPKPGGPGPRICEYTPRNRLSRLYLQALGSLLVASYYSQGDGGGIRPRLHAGWMCVCVYIHITSWDRLQSK
jgi:hypothetical protein